MARLARRRLRPSPFSIPMTEQQTYDGDWIAAWIARQRDILSQSPSHAGADANAESADSSRRWTEAGRAFFDSLQRIAVSTATPADGTLDPFNIGGALLGAWTQATSIQSSAAEHMLELLKRIPPIGLAREQTQAWREVAAAHAEYKRLEHELRAVLAKVQLDALDMLERRIRERDTKSTLGGFRELHALWVDCGEQVYGQVAHSDVFSKLQAELGNASMLLKSKIQSVLEYGLKQFDLPTRSELNSLHRQVRDLRIELEQLRSDRASIQPRRTAARKAGARKAKTGSP